MFIQNRFRHLTVLIIVLAVLLLFTANAYASLAFWVLGHEGPLLDANSRYYGNSASMYVASDIKTVNSTKVSSIYMWYDHNDYFETGHTWQVGWVKPRKFTAYEREGYTSGQVRGWFGDAEPGTSLYFELNNITMDGGASEKWRANVAGSTYDRDMNFYKANVHCAAERATVDIHNYAKFNDMKWKDYNSTWVFWSRGDWTRSSDETVYYGYYSNGYKQFESKR